MKNIIRYLLFGPDVDSRELDKAAKARPPHQTFADLARSLTEKIKGGK